ALQAAIDQAEKESLDTKFDKLVEVLKTKSLDDVEAVKDAKKRSEELARQLEDLLSVLREDNRAAKLREERLRLEELIKKLEGIIRDQKNVRAKTEIGKTAKADLKNQQKNVRNRAEKVSGKETKGGEAALKKGE